MVFWSFAAITQSHRIERLSPGATLGCDTYGVAREELWPSWL